MNGLRHYLNEALMTHPSDRLLSPISNGCYTTLFGIVPDVVAVLRAAAEIESSPAEVMSWYKEVRIRELGDLTAEVLVRMQRTQEVVNFLRSVRDGERELF
jgi:predicted benzoate:H+ symporter BenE